MQTQPCLRLPSGTVPHIYEAAITFVDDETVAINSQRFKLGQATDEGNNCLIDTLRQSLQIENLASVPTVRHHLLSPGFFGKASQRVPLAAIVKPSNFFTLDFHAMEIINLLGASAEAYKIVCLDWVHKSSGDAVGNGPTTLYIARVRENHFVPLLPVL